MRPLCIEERKQRTFILTISLNGASDGVCCKRVHRVQFASGIEIEILSNKLSINCHSVDLVEILISQIILKLR